MNGSLLSSLGSGLVGFNWLLVELLIEKCGLSRNEAISFFQDALDQLGDDAADPGQTLPLRNVIRCLSERPPDNGAPKPRFVVIEGGKEEK